MRFVTGLRCTLCGGVEPPDDNEYTCRRCGPAGIREVEFDYAALKQVLNKDSLRSDPTRGVMRYRPLLGIPDGAPISPLTVGDTPLYDAPRLAAALSIGRLWVKDDGRLPTASFKDRATVVGTARAAALGAKVVAAASTGNAATSLAGLAASMGLEAYIFVPASAPEAKIAQLLVYGAKVFLIDADYDRTYDLCQQSVARFGWYDRSAAVNPWLCEGKKTCGLELGEQLATVGLPDWVAMSVGDGCSMASTHKGLLEMQLLGISDRVPRMLAVQAEGAAPLAAAYAKNSEHIEPVEAKTIADSIRVGTPRNPLKALRAVRKSQGAFVTVSDAAILEWVPKLAQLAGVFAEPTAVAALAGIAEARQRGVIGATESVALVVTGNGLKDVKGAMQSVSLPPRLAPTLEAVERRLG